jgi:hypothetical protein
MMKDAQVWKVGAAGALIALAYVSWILLQSNWDPTSMLAVGEEATVQLAYTERVLGREVEARPHLGHDGKFFFVQAMDPWLMNPADHGATLDSPVYRSQRVLYPLLAGGFGLMPPDGIVWSLILLNITGVGFGSAFAASLAKAAGSSPWVGLAFALNPGIVGELDIDGSGVMALSLGLAGILALARRSEYWAIAAMTGAVLARETMLLFALGVAIGFWLANRVAIWRVLLVPAATALVWRTYVTVRFSGLETLAASPQSSFSVNFGRFPFEGIIEAWTFWRGDPSKLLWVACLIALVLLFARRALVRRNLVAWSAIPFVALATMLSVQVWREPYDIARALAPIFTAYPLLLFERRQIGEHAFG